MPGPNFIGTLQTGNPWGSMEAIQRERAMRLGERTQAQSAGAEQQRIGLYGRQVGLQEDAAKRAQGIQVLEQLKDAFANADEPGRAALAPLVQQMETALGAPGMGAALATTPTPEAKTSRKLREEAAVQKIRTDEAIREAQAREKEQTLGAIRQTEARGAEERKTREWAITPTWKREPSYGPLPGTLGVHADVPTRYEAPLELETRARMKEMDPLIAEKVRAQIEGYRAGAGLAGAKEEDIRNEPSWLEKNRIMNNQAIELLNRRLEAIRIPQRPTREQLAREKAALVRYEAKVKPGGLLPNKVEPEEQIAAYEEYVNTIAGIYAEGAAAQTQQGKYRVATEQQARKAWRDARGDKAKAEALLNQQGLTAEISGRP